jgi:SSS family solute:Na+ symporter/sodium/proline symporter
MATKIILVLVFVAIAIGVGIYCNRTTKTVDGFVLAGRKVGPWMSAFAYGTSYFSAVVFVGYAGQFGFKYGIAATWAGIGNAVIGSLLAWWVLGPRTREMTHRLNAQTMPEFFGKRYDSKAIRIAAAALIFIFLIPYTAGVYNGLSRLFGMAFDLPYDVCVIGMALITCIYVVVGGYMATVMNDFIQGIVMLVGIIAVVAAVLAHNGGFSEAVTQLSYITSESSSMMGPFTSFFGPDALNLLGVVILTSLGVWGLPQMVQKFYAIKSGPAIKQGAVISTIFAFVVAGGSYFMGGFGRLYADQIEYSASGTPIYDSVIPTMLSSLPDVLIGLIIVLVLSASMSTLSSLVLTSSSTLTIDLIKDNVVKDMSEKKQLVTMRVLLVLFVVVSAVIALVQYHSSIVFIAQMMGYSWGALAGSFIGPFLWGLYKRKVSKAAVWCSFIFGAGLTFVNMIMGFVGTPLIASPINCGAVCMVASLIIVPLVSLVTPAKEFEINPPSRKSAVDREYEVSVEGEVEPALVEPAMQEVLDTVKSS